MSDADDSCDCDCGGPGWAGSGLGAGCERSGCEGSDAGCEGSGCEGPDAGCEEARALACCSTNSISGASKVESARMGGADPDMVRREEDFRAKGRAGKGRWMLAGAKEGILCHKHTIISRQFSERVRVHQAAHNASTQGSALPSRALQQPGKTLSARSASDYISDILPMHLAPHLCIACNCKLVQERALANRIPFTVHSQRRHLEHEQLLKEIRAVPQHLIHQLCNAKRRAVQWLKQLSFNFTMREACLDGQGRAPEQWGQSIRDNPGAQLEVSESLHIRLNSDRMLFFLAEKALEVLH